MEIMPETLFKYMLIIVLCYTDYLPRICKIIIMLPGFDAINMSFLGYCRSITFFGTLLSFTVMPARNLLTGFN